MDGDPAPGDAAGEPKASDGVPAWLADLPPEVRRRIVDGDFESVPERYRDLMRRYQRWLAEQSKPSR
jgi:hypothetical protein